MENKNQKGEQGRKRKRKMSKEKKAKRRRQWREVKLICSIIVESPVKLHLLFSSIKERVIV